MNLVPVTDDSFAEVVLGSPKPVVLDVWAPWCPPCRPLSRVLAELADEFGDAVVMAELNSDDNPATTLTYRVMAMPTILAFRDGEVVGTIVGARPKAQLREAIAGLL